MHGVTIRETVLQVVLGFCRVPSQLLEVFIDFFTGFLWCFLQAAAGSQNKGFQGTQGLRHVDAVLNCSIWRDPVRCLQPDT